MLSWLAAYVDRWRNVVPDSVRDLVHWAAHAVAGIVYGVFRHVGAAWHQVYSEVLAGARFAAGFAEAAYQWIRQIVERDLPLLWHHLLSGLKAAASDLARVWADVLARIQAAYDAAVRQVTDAVSWVITHIYAPLKALIDQAAADILKWGYASWQLLTHPDRLAAILLDALIAAAEAAFWRIAGPAGRFILGVLLHQAARLVLLLEDIVSAVL